MAVDDYRSILYQALAAKFGLVVAVEPPDATETARARLYKQRKEIGDPALNVLQFRLSSIPGEILIVKGGPVAEEGK